MLGQPGLDLGVGVGAVVVQGQMQFQILGERALKTNPADRRDELDRDQPWPQQLSGVARDTFCLVGP